MTAGFRRDRIPVNTNAGNAVYPLKRWPDNPQRDVTKRVLRSSGEGSEGFVADHESSSDEELLKKLWRRGVTAVKSICWCSRVAA
jgi:hypothetical protein